MSDEAGWAQGTPTRRTIEPMTEAMDLFNDFWNATLARWGAEDWTAFGAECDCGKCRNCGVRWALIWTSTLLSNPSLADTAEERQAIRAARRAGLPPVVLDLDDPLYHGQSLPDALTEFDHVHSKTGVCVKNVGGSFCEATP